MLYYGVESDVAYISCDFVFLDSTQIVISFGVFRLTDKISVSVIRHIADDSCRTNITRLRRRVGFCKSKYQNVKKIRKKTQKSV